MEELRAELRREKTRVVVSEDERSHIYISLHNNTETIVQT